MSFTRLGHHPGVSRRDQVVQTVLVLLIAAMVVACGAALCCMARHRDSAVIIFGH